MTPQEIKLPTFPKYAQTDNRAIKFLSPFHAVLVYSNSIEIDVNEDYDRFTVDWNKWLNDESTGISESEFTERYNETLKKLSEV